MVRSQTRLSPISSLGVGCVAGGIEAVAMWPMEFMKTKLQLQSKYRGGPRLPFTRVLDGIKYTVRNTGILSLYDGLTVTLLLSIPKAGIRFGGNAYLKSVLMNDQGVLTMAQQFLAGVGAGVLEALLVVTPMETMKTKMIERHLDLLGGVKYILRSDGIRGLYQGVSATVLKQASNQGLRFMFFNQYKDIMTARGERSLGSVEAFLGGMAAGTFSTLGNNPFDVVKTKMQSTGATLKYKNTVDCFKQVTVA